MQHEIDFLFHASCYMLHDLCLVALLAVHTLRTIGGVACCERSGTFVGSMRMSLQCAGAGTIPEFTRITLFEPLAVAAIGTHARQWKIHALIILELLGYDDECCRASFAAHAAVLASDDFFFDRCRNILGRIGNIRRFQCYSIVPI